MRTEVLKRHARMPLVAILLAGLVSGAWGEEPSQVDASLIDQLIEQLGAPTFLQREVASDELEQIGIAARQQLEAATSNPDAEIRYRASRLLAVVLQTDFLQRLHAFAADVNGSAGATMPGWARFRQRVGDDRQARALFVEIQRSEPDLMNVYERDVDAWGSELERRAESLMEILRSSHNGRVADLSIGSSATVLLIASESEISISGKVSQLVYMFVHRQAFNAAMSGSKKKQLQRLLGDWLNKTSERNSSLLYQNVMLAMRFDLPEGLKLAVDIVRDERTNPTQRQYAMLAVGKLGGPKEVSVLTSRLGDKSTCGRATVRTQADGKAKTRFVEIQIRDVALAVAIDMTDQTHQDYGLTNIQKNTTYLFSPQTAYFESDRQRKAAMAKWEAWEKSHASQIVND